jgi:phosphatidylglycerophosphatase A
MSEPGGKYGGRAATRADLLASPWTFLGFGFGSGLAPRAPGTCGTLAAIPVCLLLKQGGSVVFLLATVLAVLGGIAICEASARRMETHDHPAIVWDEIAGFLVTMLAVPATPLNLLAGFLLFRLFDILKPWPIRAVDRRVHGGLGIMLDDVLAGGIAAVILFFMAQGNLFGLCASIP